ncbi:nitrite reductase small subunit NirD [Salibacterium halotolerans]|uniref:Nitrite reductase (NADH) small subunit n=1 Tax=Salibacterium halotolerans TaxID=1884432 RepID=A0A1I5TWI3_9BACI|nr:nitrite reductase small subunit NirD [Salibacterium halotolerans]SFP87251.1 nitrite reductase (NADH) small subunit [Salibacterium halotolerans]
MDALQGKKLYILDYEELDSHLPKEVLIGEQSIAVFLNDGDVHAIENSCPHRGGPLSQGMVSGKYVFCPLHDWKIDVTDGIVQGADEGCVKTFETTVENGAVYLKYE